MKEMIRLIALSAGVLALQVGMAQAPAGAPAGATGICKDGTYSTAPSKSGACSGHKGVQTWYAAAASKTAAPTKTTSAQAVTPAPAPAPKATPAPAPAPAPAPKAATKTSTPAPGGGAGQVWLNTASNVYHCPGTKYYGTTKAGAYMTEAEAKAKGGRPDQGKPCTK
jgi:hypothetical protein